MAKKPLLPNPPGPGDVPAGLAASPVYTSMGVPLGLSLPLIKAAGAPLDGALSRRCCIMSVWKVDASNIVDGERWYATLASVL